ncbi:MAG: hypothetical protein EU547_06085 [Promethearchaeota archaeon]|nr:MAG: hypothetical protein EU547_06085 [Candidatus Lokiarchaeota archaeon]
MICIWREILLNIPELMIVGIITTLYILVNLILAVIMIIKGIRLGHDTMVYISAIFFAGISAWGGVMFNFYSILILDILPEPEHYFLIQGGFLFIFHFFWVTGVSELTHIQGSQRRNLLFLVGILFAIIEGSYWLILITDYTLLGTVEQLFVPVYSPLSYFYLTLSLSIFTIGGGWIAIESFKSKTPRVKLKSKFLIIYVLGITFGSILEIFRNAIFGSGINAIIGSIIAKVILSVAVISGYIGFMMPPKIEELLLNNK